VTLAQGCTEFQPTSRQVISLPTLEGPESVGTTLDLMPDEVQS
jgi:hypothetical protein